MYIKKVKYINSLTFTGIKTCQQIKMGLKTGQIVWVSSTLESLVEFTYPKKKQLRSLELSNFEESNE